MAMVEEKARSRRVIDPTVIDVAIVAHDDDGVRSDRAVEREAGAAAMASMPWPMPPVRSQHVFCVTAAWMCFPLVLLAAPEALLFAPTVAGKNPPVLVSALVWGLSALLSFLHWGRYVPRGRAQIADVVAAGCAGTCVVVEAALYVRAPTRVGAVVGLLAACAFLAYAESREAPTWDRMNGFLFHNALRFAGTWLFACVAGRPAATARYGAAWWSLLLTGGVFSAHVAAEVALVNAAEKRPYAYTSQDQPSWRFKAVGICRALGLVGLTIWVNRVLWGVEETLGSR